MTFNTAKLKGRIVEKFGTQGKFAEALGVVPLTVSRKLNGDASLSREDMWEWAQTLDIPVQDIGAYFFYFES